MSVIQVARVVVVWYWQAVTFPAEHTCVLEPTLVSPELLDERVNALTSRLLELERGDTAQDDQRSLRLWTSLVYDVD